MSMNLTYTIREGFLGLKRARFSSVLTVTIIAVSLSLLGLFMVVTFNVQAIVNQFREKLSFEVFIDEGVGQEGLAQLEARLRSQDFIESVDFVSKEAALDQFSHELGEDIASLLGENPLPASFQVGLKPDFRSSDKIDQAVTVIESLNGVDEVVYQGGLFEMIARYSQLIVAVDLALLFIVFSSAILLVSNTLRLTIFSQRKSIQIMELVGARESFIRRPYLIQGMLQGGMGGAVATLMVWIGFEVIAFRFPGLLTLSRWVVLIPLGLGIVLGFWGSRVGLNRFLGREFTALG